MSKLYKLSKSVGFNYGAPDPVLAYSLDVEKLKTEIEVITGKTIEFEAWGDGFRCKGEYTSYYIESIREKFIE